MSSIRTVYSFNGQKKELERYKKPLAAAKKIYIQKGKYVTTFRLDKGSCCFKTLLIYFSDLQNFSQDSQWHFYFFVFSAPMRCHSILEFTS